MSEEHVPQCRGWWFPIEIVNLMQSGEITKSEFILLGTIDSLVSQERGCFASNAYLEKSCGLSKGSGTRMVLKLKKKGLLQDIGSEAKGRELITAWSRPIASGPGSGPPGHQSGPPRTPVRTPPDQGPQYTQEDKQEDIQDNTSPPPQAANGGERKRMRDRNMAGRKEDKRPSLLGRQTKKKAQKSSPHSPAIKDAAKRLRKLIADHNGILELPREETLAKKMKSIIAAGGIAESDLAAAIGWAEKNYKNRYCRKWRSRESTQACLQSWRDAAKETEAAPVNWDAENDGFSGPYADMDWGFD